MRIADPAIEILRECRAEGNLVFLPARQLDRKEYEAINAALVAAGGKWNRGQKAHVFTSDAAPLLANLLGGTVVDPRKDLEFFETPRDLALELAFDLDLDRSGLTILEPSAGRGALIRAVRRVPFGFDAKVWAYDIHQYEELSALNCSVVVGDFLQADGFPAYFDRVVMNPPFSKNQDIDHVRCAFNLLKPGGLLIAVMSSHWTFARGKKELAFVKFLKENRACWESLAPDAFKSSGTLVQAVKVKIRKPEAAS